LRIASTGQASSPKAAKHTAKNIDLIGDWIFFDGRIAAFGGCDFIHERGSSSRYNTSRATDATCLFYGSNVIAFEARAVFLFLLG